MLQKLNERIQGLIAWLIIVLIAITFTLFGVDYYLQSHQSSHVKLMVNSQPITEQAFDSNYRRARAQQDISQMTAADEKNLQSQVLDQMVRNEVTVQAAHSYGFDVGLNQANAAIVAIPQFQEDGHFSAEKYQQALSAALFTPDAFLSEVRQGMLLNQQRFAFMSSSFALPEEVERFVRLYMQTRDYDYLTISSAQLEKTAQVTPEAVKDYYQQHQDQFMSKELASIDYLTLSMQDIRSKIKISQDDIKNYYDENQNNYLTPAQWKVSHILLAVPEDASEEDVALVQNKAEELYAQLQKDPSQFNKMLLQSDDKLSIADGGVLPWMTAGQTEYDNALSNLTSVGQITPPEKTKHGFELFKLVDYKPVTKKSLVQVEDTIKEQLLVDRVQAKYAESLEQLSDLGYQTPDSLAPVADALHLTIKTSKAFSQEGGDDELTKNKAVINATFSHDILELGNNSEPIQLDNDTVVVLRLNKHIPSVQQKLPEVYALIEQKLKKQQADLKAQALGADLLGPVEGKKQKELIAAHQLKWQSVTQSSRDNDKEHALINDLAFNLLRPESRSGVTLENGDYVVVRLKQIHDGVLANLDSEHQDSLIQQIEASYGMMDYDLYVNSLVTQAKIS